MLHYPPFWTSDKFSQESWLGRHCSIRWPSQHPTFKIRLILRQNSVQATDYIFTSTTSWLVIRLKISLPWNVTASQILHFQWRQPFLVQKRPLPPQSKVTWSSSWSFRDFLKIPDVDQSLKSLNQTIDKRQCHETYWHFKNKHCKH